MRPGFVIDSSVALMWCFADQATAASGRLLDRLEAEAAVVPGLWYLELANVLALTERKGKISAAMIAEFIAMIDSFELDIDREGAGRAWTGLLPLCRAYQLTSYDAVYLELAMRRRLPLATVDQALRAAAKKAGVEVLGE